MLSLSVWVYSERMDVLSLSVWVYSEHMDVLSLSVWVYSERMEMSWYRLALGSSMSYRSIKYEHELVACCRLLS